ncbi:hypothetical protein ACMHYO_01190 [Allopusillimonas ginsengisoli]|uniref:hypothetical protein n=1 Tax=Allopusillimonas ginsengisoli TaxID=453575 RepID=UPI0039C2FD70
MWDRDGIFDYIESESAKSAMLVDGRIEDQVNQLARLDSHLTMRALSAGRVSLVQYSA